MTSAVYLFGEFSDSPYETGVRRISSSVKNYSLVPITSLPPNISNIASGENIIAAITDSTKDLYLCGGKKVDPYQLGLPPPITSFLEDFKKEPPPSPTVPTADLQFHRHKIKGEIVKIKIGPTHSAAITNDNKAYAWGSNTIAKEKTNTKLVTGQLGNEYDVSSQQTELQGYTGKPIDVACGAAHTAVLTESGVYTCGWPDKGVLGRNGITHLLGPVMLDFNVTRIECGFFHTVVITESRGVYAWGSNSKGQLGLTKDHASSILPVKILIEDVKAVSCGGYHNVAVTLSGDPFVWGSNKSGEIGMGKDKKIIYSPEPIEAVKNVIQASCSHYRSSLLTDEGIVYITGRCASVNGTSHQFSFRIMEDLYNKHICVVKMAIGQTHIFLLNAPQWSSALETIVSACSFDLEIKLPYLKTVLKTLPPKRINDLQTRALRYLHEKSKKESPFISADTSYIKFQIKGEEVTKIINLTNETDSRVYVSASVTGGDLIKSSKYSFVTSPHRFLLEKRSSGAVKISLRCYSSIQERLISILSFTVENDRSQKLKVSRLFLLCDVLPNRIQQQVELRSGPCPIDLLQVFASYVPKFIVAEYQHLVQSQRTVTMDVDAVQVPSTKKLLAAILFIDVSGFTALNERLAVFGSAGPEKVSKHLNTYFGQLINAVLQGGGDVLKFAGDALICLFGEAGPLPPFTNPAKYLEEITMKAIQCGVDIQKNLAEYDSQEGFTLTLHIGIGAGDIHAVHVGGVDGCCEFLVIGDPLLQLKTAVDNSKSGEVCISEPAYKIVGNRCVCEARGLDWVVKKIKAPPVPPKTLPVAPKLVPQLEAILRSYIQPGVQARLDSFQTRWLAELRQVTTLFVKLSSLVFQKGQPLQLESIHHVLCIMQRIIFRYEGMVRQFLVDDKGTVLIAVFGVPPYSHEDDTFRGLKAALEIHTELVSQNMKNSIGITTGGVFCGGVGNNQRQEYAVVGDTVNLSARLMGVADSQGVGLLCDEITYQSTKDRADLKFDTLDPVKVKGKQFAVAIFRPHSVNVELSKTTKLTGAGLTIIGREIELVSIRTHIEKLAKGGKGSVFVLEGGAGMGKTALVEFATYVAKINKIEYYIAHTSSTQRSPFFLWTQILRQIMDLAVEKRALQNPLSNTSFVSEMLRQHDSSIDAFLLKFSERLATSSSAAWASKGHWVREHLPLLNSLLPLNIPQTDFTLGLTNDRTRHSCLISLLLFILQCQVSKAPVILVVEDAQWADSVSLSLLRSVASEVRPLFLMITTRPPGTSQQNMGQYSEIEEIVQLPETETLRLEPLSSEEANSLVLRRITAGIENKESSRAPLASAGTALPDELLKTIEKAEGNPLFLVQLAYSLREFPGLELQTDRDGRIVVSFSGSEALKLPSSVESVIGSRLDQLLPSSQFVLKVASVLGIEFSKVELETIYPLRDEQIRGQMGTFLAELVQQEYLEEKAPGIFAFHSTVIREVAYSRLLFEQRQSLHYEAAVYYENLLLATTTPPNSPSTQLQTYPTTTSPPTPHSSYSSSFSSSSSSSTSSKQPLPPYLDWRECQMQLAYHWTKAVRDNPKSLPRHQLKALQYLMVCSESVTPEDASVLLQNGLEIVQMLPDDFPDKLKLMRELERKAVGALKPHASVTNVITRYVSRRTSPSRLPHKP